MDDTSGQRSAERAERGAWRGGAVVQCGAWSRNKVSVPAWVLCGLGSWGGGTSGVLGRLELAASCCCCC